jgi:hypothetical protein
MADPQTDLFQFLTRNGVAKGTASPLSAYCEVMMSFRSIPNGVDPDNVIDFFLAGPPTSLLTARVAFPTNGCGSRLDPDTDASTFRVQLQEAVAAWVQELPKKPPTEPTSAPRGGRGRSFR